jgi:hypothetical protein
MVIKAIITILSAMQITDTRFGQSVKFLIFNLPAHGVTNRF